MKILFLNTWNGRQGQLISDFLKSHINDVDIFCLQEMYRGENNMESICQKIMPDYIPAFAYKKVEGDDYAQANYVHPRIKVIQTETLLPDNYDVGLGIVTTIDHNGHNICITNFHGRATPGHKQDTPERLQQSQGILNFFKNRNEVKIIGGDFNCDLNIQSLLMFEDAGYINLLKTHDIRTTRNKVAWEQYPDNPQFYADFVFIDKEVKMKKFEVIDNEVSDHLPMILEIE